MKAEGVNALNAICPYFTMFPLDFPERVITEYYIPETAVFDPFCGRGTSLFAARKKGIYSIGVDSSPVAVAAAQAKLVNTTPERIIRVAERILSVPTEPEVPDGEFWEYAYESNTLYNLCKIRQSLLKNCLTPERQALRAIVMGALHGPLTKNGSSYLSNQSPRTYAPKPKYSVKFWKERDMFPPKVDVMNVISTRAYRYYSDSSTSGCGFVLRGDSRNRNIYNRVSSRLLKSDKDIGLIITSPPYYGMRTYIPDQWLRNWFVGGLPNVDYDASKQISHNGIETFTEELEKVWVMCSRIATQNAILAIRFGAINDRVVEPEKIIINSLENTPWRIIRMDNSGIPPKERRQVNSFSVNKLPKEQIEEIDVIARLNL